MTLSPKGQFKRWMSSPPRPHGAVIEDRVVSNLELFYDLVYVAVIGQAADRLSEDISVRTVIEFVIVFTMLWFAWLNGSLYIELHGREDGRTRLIVFAHMGILALLAVFTASAASSTGTAFAAVYTVFLLLMTWQWWSVRQLDRTFRPEFLPVTAWYVTAMVVSTIVIGASTLLAGDARLVTWAAFGIGWLIGFPMASRPRAGLSQGILPTESLVERFGLFTLIVLGEVVVGVVNGLAATEADALTVVTGLLALAIGFGFWWLYFDLVGRRRPRNGRGVIAAWMIGHLPVTLAITASGAAVVSLVEHAHDATTPPETAWLLAGSVAAGLLALIAVEATLEDAVRLRTVYRPLAVALLVGAVLAVIVGWLAPAPWVLSLLLVAILSIVWFGAVAWLIRAGAWGNGSEP